MESKGLVPKLRFPEFQEAPPWAPQPLRNVLKFQPGYPFPSAGFNENGNGLRLIRNRDLRSDDQIVYYSMPFGDEFVVSDGDVLIGMDGDFTPIVWNKGRSLLNQRVGRILVKGDTNLQFLHFFLVSHLKKIETATARTTVKHLSHSSVEELNEPLPESSEQQKIGECLTSLDDLIAAERRKLEALRTFKKGLLQNLFPRPERTENGVKIPAETTPRLRFQEFRNSSAWERKFAGDLFTNRKEGGEVGLPLYSVTMNDGLVPRASLDRDFYDIEDPSGNKKATKGDIVYNMMRMWQGAQGVATEDCMVSPAYVVLAPSKHVCSDFFAYLFKLPQSLHLLTSHSRGLTKDRLRLYFEDFKKIPLRIPKLDEQQRIANCLSSLDTLITTQTKKLDTLRIHKQGLMQNLFPKMEDVTR